MFADNENENQPKKPKKEQNLEAGDYNFGDDFTKVGEGHDPEEDEVL